MPIYSNLYSNLARQGFTKTFTHGYAQSVVAATHPQVYASNNRPSFALQRRASKAGHYPSYHFQNAFHTSASSSSIVVQERLDKNEGGLDAYFDAWDKQHPVGEPEKEWKQFKFPERIEWKPSSIVVEAEGQSQVEIAADEAVPRAVERSYSTSALDELRSPAENNVAQFAAAEAAALAQIDAAIEKEIKSRNDQEIFERELSIVAARVPTPPLTSESPAPSTASGLEKSPTSAATSVLTEAELQSQNYADHLSELSASGQYDKIPTLFEGMRIAGIKPTATAYNALLDARINLPGDRIQIALTASDIYLDMVRSKVLPNTATYNTLINLLASHSLDVAGLKRRLEEKRSRFGGMEEAGKFMFASNEFEFEILSEADRLDLAIRMFDASVVVRTDRSYPAETYHQLITACAEAGRVPDMVRVYEHMEKSNVVPLATTFSPLISGFTAVGDLTSAVECYNEYKQLAIAHNNGTLDLVDRQDAQIYGTVVKAYVTSDKLEGAMQFYHKIMDAYGANAASIRDCVVYEGFVEGLVARGHLSEALGWADGIQGTFKATAMSKIATVAADNGDKLIASAAFAHVPAHFEGPTMAMLALSVRDADVISAQKYWQILSGPEMNASSSFVEPTAMYAVAMIGSGSALEGLTQADQMFARIRSSVGESNKQVGMEIDEAIDFIGRYMSDRGIADPRLASPEAIAYQQTFTPTPYSATPAYEDTFDPYAASTDFKGSTLIADELERGSNSRAKTSRLSEALGRFKNMRRAGRHPRYITYAKLISAAAREERSALVNDILGMAKSDIPLLVQYPVVRYGWVSILDAMVGASLTLGNRGMAAQYHQELNDMGAAPTANTFGLYITTLKESTKTFDEASEAVKIFHRAKSEGVEPSSFLYNALIGKLGKARRIDDCLFYFAEMRALGIRPTSVTYGTIVNALCRVSDEKFAEELFEEMESMPNYKARPAPYNSLMQFFLTTKRDKAKVLAYYERMQSKGIQPTNHTYKLLVDTHATLEPVNMPAAEAVLDVIRSTGQKPEAVHYSSLIHAKGCVLHDMEGARAVFDSVMADSSIRPQACLYQALFESMVANHRVSETEPILREMASRRVEMTPYIANTLIHGWANKKDISKSKSIFGSVGREKREPSTYEAMTRAYLAVEDRLNAKATVQEMLSRGYPSAVSNKILELLGGGNPEVAL
ncbi:pentatricopeptide repeat domain-containing protein [Phlyctema vagabunda]|uniref:Pentatricopeptide repeat domain-containing protein n=1 Tax=Phlyctema vagabunda TaxID=108571 RepID=A0ABR4P546_9HELO